MRTVLVGAAAVWLVGCVPVPEAPPFEGLEAPGVYVTVDGYGITIEQSAVDWNFSLPDGSKAEWKKGSGSGRPPHVEISCRAAGGYSPSEALRAVWTIPRPDGMPRGLSAEQRVYWDLLWPWTYHGGLDLALSAIVRGGSVVLSETPDSSDLLVDFETWLRLQTELRSKPRAHLEFTVLVEMQFQVDPETAFVARQLARYCTATE